MYSNAEDRSVRVLRNEDKDCYLARALLSLSLFLPLRPRWYSRNTENKPWVSGGIVQRDVEASSKLIVDSRTIASQ